MSLRILQNIRPRTCCRSSLVVHPLCGPNSKLNSLRLISSRLYATHRDAVDSSTLSQSLDTKRQAFRPRESVGPFQLASSSLNSTERVKKWSELSTAGKSASSLKPYCAEMLILPESKTYNSKNLQSCCDCGWSWSFCRPDLLLNIRAVLEKFSDCAVRSSMRTHQNFPRGWTYYIY